MTPERWQQIKQLFEAALKREPGQRLAYLTEACGSDTALQREVEALISSYEDAAGLTEAQTLEAQGKQPAENRNDPMEGRRIGSYRVIREIGHGGMGAVYLAFRADDQYHKQVAIKLVRSGMDSDSILRRFRKERQILANLEHPNIARLFDGGTTEEGWPYFVMEYIDGHPIDVYCDKRRLSVAERLKLFCHVCSAVQHAHKNLVVHRDLKPSNILLTPDGDPKLLDFGIAKILHPESSLQTIESTLAASRPMTPEYASPEQVRGEEITTASDVYSLGVLLYELLTGHRPYRLASRHPEELARVICEHEPEKASEVISRVVEVTGPVGLPPIILTPELVSQTREGQPEKLRRCLAGDLDNILSMALRKEPQRRYTSIAQFSEDIRRHLQGLPVMARKDSLSYRTEKFVRRQKRAVLAGLFLLLTLGLTTVLAYLWVSNRKTLDVMPLAVRTIAVLPLKTMGNEGTDDYLGIGVADALITKLGNLRRVIVRPTSAVLKYGGANRDVLAAGRELKVEATLEGTIQMVGDRIRATLQLVRVQDGSPLWAERFDEKFTDIFAVQDSISQKVAEALMLKLTSEEEKRLTKRHTDNVEAYHHYLKGRYFWNKRTGDGFRKAIEYFEKAIDKDSGYALAYAGLADCYNMLGGYDILGPKEAFPKAKDMVVKALVADETLAEAHTALAFVRGRYEWDWPGAEAEFRRAIQLNPNYATAHHWYGLHLGAMGRFDEALDEVTRARELDPLSLIINTNIGWILHLARKYDQAGEQYLKTLEMDPDFAVAHLKLGWTYEQRGMYGEAVEEDIKAAIILGARADKVEVLRHAYEVSGIRGYRQKQLDFEKQRQTQDFASSITIAGLCASLGKNDEAFQWLEKAYVERSAVSSIYVEPQFDGLRSDPRFRDLLRRVGLGP